MHVKILVLIVSTLTLLSGCGPVDHALYGGNVKVVEINGIKWKVAPIETNEFVYAVGVMDGIYGTRQLVNIRVNALEAVERVTGCTVVPESIIQIGNIGTVYTTQVDCPPV